MRGTDDTLPPAIHRVLSRLVTSVTRLELIRCLRDHRDHAWTAAELATTLCFDREEVEHALEAFHRAGLLARARDAHRYAPDEPRHAAIIDALLDLYQHHPRRILQVLDVSVPRMLAALSSVRFSAPRSPPPKPAVLEPHAGK